MVKTTYGIVGKDTNVSDKKCKIKTIYVNQILDYYNQGIIKMPDFQREIDQSKVDEIRDTFIEFHKNEENYFIKHGFSLSLCKIGDGKELWVVDGQHRLRAMEALYKLGYDPYVMIRIGLCDTLDEMKKDYKLLNTNSDLPIIYTSFENEFIQKLLIDLRDTYKKRYTRAFCNSKKETNHTNRQHIDKWLELFIPDKINYGSIEDLDAKLMEINNKISEFLNNGKNFDFYIKTRDKKIIEETGLYLHLRNIKWVDYFYNGDEIVYTSCNYNKKPIPKALKKSVYNRDFGDKEYIGKCWVCETEIDRDNSHIGHMKAEAMGGKTVLDNLRAICVTCNLSMGTTHMVDFKSNYFKKV
tara:strand:+ start:3024 stop:4088 length:1065 start_codon:yes stop_codon:yes gene_type:complete